VVIITNYNVVCPSNKVNLVTDELRSVLKRSNATYTFKETSDGFVFMLMCATSTMSAIEIQILMDDVTDVLLSFDGVSYETSNS
jgi:hypothetical protein